MRAMQLLLPGGGKLKRRFVNAALATASKSWRGDKEEFHYVLNGGQDDADRRRMRIGIPRRKGVEIKNVSESGSESGDESGVKVVEVAAASPEKTSTNLAEGKTLMAASGEGLGGGEGGDEGQWYSRQVFTSGPGDAFGKRTRWRNYNAARPPQPIKSGQADQNLTNRLSTLHSCAHINICMCGRAFKTVRGGAAYTRNAARYGKRR